MTHKTQTPIYRELSSLTIMDLVLMSIGSPSNYLNLMDIRSPSNNYSKHYWVSPNGSNKIEVYWISHI